MKFYKGPDDVPDSAELDALSELERHPGYVQVRTRIEEVIELRRDALEKDEVVRFDQGYIAGLRMVLGLPEILRGEIVESIKDGDSTA